MHAVVRHARAALCAAAVSVLAAAPARAQQLPDSARLEALKAKTKKKGGAA